jgi:protein TonB
MKPLRCLLFSSNGELIHPIWPVLADLGIEGEYCQSAVDAVEKVTTQVFEIVITDWEDQPEAAFLLKTARDLKAAQRPLTLAIVGDDARRPEALQAGANSILLKPIRPEQVRDTLSTACELLRSKAQPVASGPMNESPATAFAAAALPGAVSAPVPLSKSPENVSAGVLVHSPSSAPAARVQPKVELKTLEEPAAGKVEVVTEFERNASALGASSTPRPNPPEVLTGWAMLQARLTRPAPRAATGAPGKNELLGYEDPSSYGSRAERPPEEHEKAPAKKQSQRDEPEATLFAYISGKSAQESEQRAKLRPRRGTVFLVGLVVVCVALGAAPRTRQILQTIYRHGVRTGSRLLNPPPAPLPQAVAVHDSFGQSGDEYNLPVPTTIPDATTDPSQIRVLPVIDPTAKPQKTPDATSVTEQAPAAQNPSADQNQTAPGQDSQEPGERSEVRAADRGGENMPGNPTEPVPAVVTTQTRPAPSAQVVQVSAPQPPLAPSPAVPRHVVSAAVSAGIPSSLKSQVTSSTPQSSGSKPIEAAMSSIEPVNLPELVARELLAQPIDPAYPAAAKATGQRGSVVLQVLIGRDGTVQDAKFLQGSLVFARAAIDAVKQWRFKPYLLNGRAVSVQSVITLNFKPPA